MMKEPARQLQIIKKPGRLIILAGEKEIQDLLAFLICQRLDEITKTGYLNDE